MEIKVRLSEIVNSVSALNDLSSQRMVAKTGLQIGRALKVILNELESYEKIRIKLAQQWGGVPDPQTGDFKFSDRTVFDREYRELMDSQITIQVDKIKLTDLGDCKLQVGTMMQLAWLIDDTIEEVKKDDKSA